MTEDKIDRRAHWAQIVATGIIIATAWCVKLEMTTSGLKSDMEIQKARRDEMLARMAEKINQDHDRTILNERDIQWLKSGHNRNDQ